MGPTSRTGRVPLELLRVPGRIAGPLEGPDRRRRGSGCGPGGRSRRTRCRSSSRRAGRCARARSGDRAASSRSACQKQRGSRLPVRAHHPGVAIAQVLPLGHAEVRPSRARARRPGSRRAGGGCRACPCPGTTISPSSPRVQVTSTTRWPAATALAMVPPVPIVSSSGWAWTVIRVGRWPAASVVMVPRC